MTGKSFVLMVSQCKRLIARVVVVLREVSRVTEGSLRLFACGAGGMMGRAVEFVTSVYAKPSSPGGVE